MHYEPSIAVELHPGILRGVERPPGPFDEGPDPDADGVISGLAALLLLAAQGRQVEQLERLVEGRGVIAAVVERSGGGAVGEGGGGDEVGPPYRHRVESGPAGEGVHRPFDGVRRLGPSRPSVGRGGSGGGHDGGGGHREVGDVVEALGDEPREGRHLGSELGVGAHRGDDLDVGAPDAAAGVARQPHAMNHVAAVGAAEEVLAAGLQPADGPAQSAGGGKQYQVLGIETALGTEAAADVGNLHCDVFHIEDGNELALQAMGCLMAHPQSDTAVGFRDDQRGESLDGDRCQALVAHGHLDLDVVVPSLIRRAERPPLHDVGTGLGMQHGGIGERLVHVGDRRQRVDVHPGEPGGVHGLRSRLCDHHPHRFPQMPHPIAGEGGPMHAGDGNRTLGWHVGQVEVGGGEHRHHSGATTGVVEIEGGDGAVGHVGANEGGVEQPLGAEVSHVGPGAGDQSGVFYPAG